MEKFPVDVLGTHANPHWDEFIAFILLRMYGKEKFPGIENAVIKIYDDANDLKHSAEDYLIKYKILMVGICKGMLDEHGPNSEGKCCADLTAELLGIHRNKKIALLLKAVRRADRDGKTTPLDLAQCIDLLNKYTNKTPDQIEKFLFKFFKHYLNEKISLPQTDQTGSIVFPVKDIDHRNLQNHYERWLIDREKTLSSQLQNISILTKYIKTLTSRPPSKLFDLAEIVGLINVFNPDDPEVAYRWVSTIFDAKLAAQTELDQAIKIVKKAPIKRVETDGERVRIMEITNTDNKSLLKAARYLDSPPDILVIQKIDKHVLIFNLRSNGSFPWIVATIRIVEQLRCRVKTRDLITDFNELSQPGVIRNLDMWYYFVTDRGVKFGLFNGSLTRPKLSPTTIPFYQLHLIIREALDMSHDPRRWKQWVDEQIQLRKKALKKDA